MQYLSNFLIIVVTVAITACDSTKTAPISTDNPGPQSTWSIIADASKNRNTTTGTSVQVSGADSIETTEKKVLKYQSSIAKKPTESNAEPPTPNNAVNPRFKPDVDGEYKLQLEVSIPDSETKETSYVTIIADGTQRGPSVEVDQWRN